MTGVEIIVRFRRGVPEAEARDLIAGLQCSVRRRIRDDAPDIVTLIVRGERGAVGAAEAALRDDARVDHVEDNARHEALDEGG